MLTREEILAVPVGRELDALVHKNVFLREVYWQNIIPYPVDNLTAIPVPLYSTDLSAAWEVVEKLHELGYTTHLQSDYPDDGAIKHGLLLFHNSKGRIKGDYAETAPLAICRAALLSIQGEE